MCHRWCSNPHSDWSMSQNQRLFEVEFGMIYRDFSSSYDSSVVQVLYSLYFDENLGDFRSNMFARIDNIMWWDGPFSTVLYLFFATGVAHSHKTDDEWPRKLSRPHPKDTQGRIPLNDKPYWEVSFFSLFFFFFSSFFLFLFLFFPLPPKGQNLPRSRSHRLSSSS